MDTNALILMVVAGLFAVAVTWLERFIKKGQ